MSEIKHDLQVFEVPPREVGVRDHFNLSLALLGNLNSITEVSDTTIHLDLVLEEFLECRYVEDLIACRLRSIDDEL